MIAQLRFLNIYKELLFQVSFNDALTKIVRIEKCILEKEIHKLNKNK